jgi:competence protein ComGC
MKNYIRKDLNCRYDIACENLIILLYVSIVIITTLPTIIFLLKKKTNVTKSFASTSALGIETKFFSMKTEKSKIDL